MSDVEEEAAGPTIELTESQRLLADARTNRLLQTFSVRREEKNDAAREPTNSLNEDDGPEPQPQLHSMAKAGRHRSVS